MKYRNITKEAFNVAGIRAVTEWAGGVWGIVKSDGNMERMQQIAGESKVTLGLCFGFDEKGYNDNMVGFFTELDELDDYEVINYPESKWIELVAEGKISDNLLENVWQKMLLHKEMYRPLRIMLSGMKRMIIVKLSSALPLYDLSQ